jgi:hypothetical protein
MQQWFADLSLTKCHAIARQQFRPLADDRLTGVLTLALIPVHGVAQLGSNTGRA